MGCYPGLSLFRREFSFTAKTELYAKQLSLHNFLTLSSPKLTTEIFFNPRIYACFAG